MHKMEMKWSGKFIDFNLFVSIAINVSVIHIYATSCRVGMLGIVTWSLNVFVGLYYGSSASALAQPQHSNRILSILNQLISISPTK